jgi:hypothetical protein
MENNENLVTEEVTENVEQTTEETRRNYSEAEFNEAVNKRVGEVMGGKIARREAKIRKEYDRKYGDLMDTLRAGTGKESVEELNDTFSKFYESKGIKIERKPTYSDKDNEILARAEADEIIRSGFEEVVDEVDRLTEIGAANMSKREKAIFKILAEHRRNAERGNELAEIGVTEDVYNSKDFQEFASMFKESTPISKIYENYTKTQPKKEIRTMGSMKTNDSADNGIKDFYTIEEAKRFTQKDFEKNPKLFEKVVESSHKW